MDYRNLLQNVLSEQSTLMVNKVLISKYGIELAVFLAYLVSQERYFKNEEFYIKDVDAILFCGINQNSLTKVKQKGVKLNFFKITRKSDENKMFFNSYYELNHKNILSAISSVENENNKELAINRELKDKEFNKENINEFSRAELKLIFKKVGLSYRGNFKKEDFINKFVEYSLENPINSKLPKNLVTSLQKNQSPVTKKFGHQLPKNLVINLETENLKKENLEIEEEEQKTSSASADINSFEEKALAELERAKFKNINKNTIKNIKKHTNSLKDIINAILYIENTKKAKDVAILIALLRDKDYEIILEEKKTNKKKETNRALFKNNEIKTIEIKETKEEKELREKKEKLSTIIMNLVLSMPRRLKLAEELTFINNIQNFNLFLLKIEKLKAELETKETV